MRGSRECFRSIEVQYIYPDMILHVHFCWMNPTSSPSLITVMVQCQCLLRHIGLYDSSMDFSALHISEIYLYHPVYHTCRYRFPTPTYMICIINGNIIINRQGHFQIPPPCSSALLRCCPVPIELETSSTLRRCSHFLGELMVLPAAGKSFFLGSKIKDM